MDFHDVYYFLFAPRLVREWSILHKISPFIMNCSEIATTLHLVVLIIWVTNCHHLIFTVPFGRNYESQSIYTCGYHSVWLQKSGKYNAKEKKCPSAQPSLSSWLYIRRSNSKSWSTLNSNLCCSLYKVVPFSFPGSAMILFTKSEKTS